MNYFDRSRILIGVPGTFNYPHSKNWIECESTWIPKLREKGYDVKILLSDPEQNINYKIKGNFFITKNSDFKDGLYYKNYHYMSEYILSNNQYDYYVKIDSDSFVHPERFDEMISSLFINEFETPDYLGCCVPYRGWNSHDRIFTKIDEGYGFASGTGMMLSRKSLQIILNDFNPSVNTELHFDDKIVGDILRDKVSLYHDSRILFFSKYDMAEVVDLSPDGPSFISDDNSQLAIQHYCSGHMSEIMYKIYN